MSNQTSAFVLYQLKRRGQLITEGVLCQSCYDTSFAMKPLTEKEVERGYEQVVRQYDGDRACADCDAEPMVNPECATDSCHQPAGRRAHPYYPELCRSCGDLKAMKDGAAAHEDRGAA